jgi:SSS family solute:Na+ symporter
VFGLGFAASFAYWTTDFLVIQRAFSAKDLRSAKLSPVIGSFFKILLGFVIVGSGMLALSLLHDPGSGFTLLQQGGKVNYDSAIPLLMMRYFPAGMLGLGITTLVAMFMAGQAGNMSALTAVWTYDIYQPVFNKKASPAKLIRVGRIATVVGVVLSIGAAYWARSMPTIIDFLLAINSFILVPMFTIILLGMFFKKITPTAAFWGVLIGMVSSFIMFLLLEIGWIGPSAITPSSAASDMSANFWRAIWAFLITGTITVAGSFFTAVRPESELKGLVKGLGSVEKAVKRKAAVYKFYRTPEFWAGVSLIIFIFLNIYFW